MSEEDPAGPFLALTEQLLHSGPAGMSPLGAGILAALALGIAGDSRSFSRDLGVAHALVLREIGVLEADFGLLRVTKRDDRTQRLWLEPTEGFKRLLP